MSKSGYVAPNVSVDSVIFQLVDGELMVLLIKRASAPFKDKWALPGGYMPVGETSSQANARILNAKAGLSLSRLGYLEQIYTFDTVARDPRGHALSITFMGLGRALTPKASQQTHSPVFFPVQDLPDDLAFDHGQIIKFALDKLKSKITHTNAVSALLPKMFTLSQAQTAYEKVLNRKLDKRNFRKKFMSLGLALPTSEHHMDGAHRPARLYKFKNGGLVDFSRSF